MKPKTNAEQLKTKDFPKHVAFIMDGNRRWAKAKGLSPFKGHILGEDRIEPLIDYAIEKSISHLTFWAFSTENWNRQKQEVDFLLNMFRNDLAKKVDSFHAKNVKLNIIGNLSMFPKDIQEKTYEWMSRTRNNTKITVNVALSYGGRDEIIRALQRVQTSNMKFNDVTVKSLGDFLDTAGQPDPDLLIRTGGEQRLSGFLLWQLEYAELYFTDTYWPDFTPVEFEKALLEYQHRQRRFGK